MIHYMDEVALSADRRYEAFLLQLVGAFTQVMGEPAPSAPIARKRLGQLGSHAQAQLLTALGFTVDRAATTLVEEAIKSAHPTLSDPQRANVASIVNDARRALMGEIALASEKDSNVVTRTARQFALDVDILMSTQGASYTGAVISARMQLDPHFKFHQLDRIGRRWPSIAYARTAVRGFLVNTYIDTYLYALSARGVDMAVVTHPDPGHLYANVVFSISGSIPHLPSYRSIKDEVWHPNSRALVRHR